MGGGDRRWGDVDHVGSAVTCHYGHCNCHGDVIVVGGCRCDRMGLGFGRIQWQHIAKVIRFKSGLWI